MYPPPPTPTTTTLMNSKLMHIIPGRNFCSSYSIRCAYIKLINFTIHYWQVLNMALIIMILYTYIHTIVNFLIDQL